MEEVAAFSARPLLRALLNHFAKVKDTRQSWKVAYPLREMPARAAGRGKDAVQDWKGETSPVAAVRAWRGRNIVQSARQ
jgi:hypothetical protein